MSPGGTYALITFLVGLLFLLGWLYATAGNPRSGSMLKKSLLLFALPIIFSPARFFQFPLGMWAWIACEEGLKAFASTREQRPSNRFWLVSLFGIWELILDKPFWGFVLSRPMANWDRLQVGELVYATILPVLMHTVSAAIYAFAFERRIWAAFIASWVIHTTFNEAVGYFGVSLTSVVVETVTLTIILVALLGSRVRLRLPGTPEQHSLSPQSRHKTRVR